MLFDLVQIPILLAMVVCVAAALFTRRSWPLSVRAEVEAVTARLIAAEANVDALQAKWHQSAAEHAEFLEAAEGVLEAVETKRRRMAAREAKGATPVEPADRRISLLRQAREQGHAV